MKRRSVPVLRFAAIAAPVVALGVALAALGVVIAPPADAHPLGNFSVNTYAGLVVAPTGLSIDYVVDMAELPTQQVRERAIRDPAAFADAECNTIAGSLAVTAGGEPVPLRGRGVSAVVGEGAAGLAVLRLECALSGEHPFSRSVPFVLEDGYAKPRVGWHEATVVGDGARVSDSTVSSESVTKRLSAYPDGGVRSPRSDTTVRFVAAPGGPRLDAGLLGAAPNPAVHKAQDSFLSLVDHRRLTVAVGLASIGLAAVLGALHAIAPGHGKTVMAAYLVGQRGTLRQALGIGATVTLTHTAGVLILGLVLSVSTVLAPERVYPVLGVISGLIVALLGVTLLGRGIRARRRGELLVHRHDYTTLLDGAALPDRHGHGHHGHDHHDHHDHHGHDHHGHHHGDGGPHHHERGLRQRKQSSLSWGSIVLLGLAGGMVPSPSALVVLIGSIALGRTWFGVALVLAYGAGMAAALIVAGLVLVRVRARIERYVETPRGERMARLVTALPLATSALILAGGLVLAARAAGGL